jgi:Zn-dependent peptidase ImmA (M78 family)
MPIIVPYLSKERIERDAEALLAEFALKRGVVIAAPVPIEDIIEKHLKFLIVFDDLHRLIGLPRNPEGDADILGAIFFNDRRIVIDQSLDPDENRFVEGRLRFTLAHEGGHSRLHSHLFTTVAPVFVCRSSRANERAEWQANFYASCLLMPKDLLMSAWRERFGNTNPRILRRMFCGLTLPDEFASFWSFEQQWYDERVNAFVRPFAGKFQVSMESMRIRLQQIGLLRLEIQHQRSSPSAA